MNTAKLIISILALSSLHLFANDNLPLKIDAGPGWKIEYKDDRIHFFSITRPGEDALLMFSRSPIPGGKNEITALLKKVAEGFLESAKRDSLKVKQEYKTETIEGVEYSGEAVVFESDHGTQTTVFMISNGGALWTGQFSGSAPMWEEAKNILKKLKQS